MSGRVEPEAQLPPAETAPLALALPAAVAAIAADPDDRYGGHALPNDHPAWMKDTLSISQRARALLLQIKPVVFHVVHFWEHRVRSIVLGNGRLSVDPSGSYRLD